MAKNDETFEPKFKTLCEIYERSVREFADRELFGTKQDGAWKWMTYAEFGRQTDEIRGGLAALGIGEGDTVAMIANNRPEWAVCAYATYGLAAKYAPMYESQLAKDWEYILRDCAAKVVFVANDEIRAAIEELAGNLPSLGHVIESAGVPASTNSCASIWDNPGVCGAGFQTTALPAAIAGPILWQARLNGALNGVIAATTPTGNGSR